MGLHIKSLKYVVITPVRDEADYIQKTIDSMVRQSILPLKWVIVNDGSVDQTPSIIGEAAQKYPWITAIHRANRGFRKPGGGVIEAFYEGYDRTKIDNFPWDFIVKLDGDLSFEPDYFQKCFDRFEKEPNLGMGGGTICQMVNGKLKVDSPNDPPFHVRGATKLYRRACWEKISPLVKAPGWDTIDEVKANLHGWATRTFGDLKLTQHKETGGADGNWRNWFKNGRANYITGYHPLFMLAKCFKKVIREALLVESAALLAGFCSGYLKKIARVEAREAIHYLRKQQIRRMLMRPSIYG